jgi:hypothetical protein
VPLTALAVLIALGALVVLFACEERPAVTEPEFSLAAD